MACVLRALLLSVAVMLSVGIGAVAAAPAYQAAGTALNSAAGGSPAWPAHVTGDVALLFCESTGGQPVSLTTSNGFAAVFGTPPATGAGTAGTRMSVFWARASSNAMLAPVVSDPGDHVYCRILTYRGVVDTDPPWDAASSGVKATASAGVTVAGVTTTVPDTLIVQAVARDNDSTAVAFSNIVNGNLTGIVERSDGGATQGNGGGFGVWDGVMASAGSTGGTTATVTSSINAFVTIALRPAAYYTRVTTGNWSNVATWSTAGCGGIASASVPAATSLVTLCNGANIALDVSVAIRGLTLQGNATSASVTLTHGGANALTVGAGGVTLNGAASGTNTKLWNIGAGTATVNGPLEMNGGSADTRTVNISLSTGTLDINGDLSMTGGTAARSVVTATGAANIFLSGSFAAAAGTLAPGASSTFTYDGAAQTVAASATIQYRHLNLIGAATAGGALNVNGNFTLGGSGSFSASGFTHQVGGDFTNNGLFAADTSTVIFDGATAQALTGTTIGTLFYDLVLNNASGLTLTGAHSVAALATLTLTSGRITTNANLVYILSGNAIAGAGANNFVVGNLRKRYSGTGNQERAFEVGTVDSGTPAYAPVSIRFGAVTTAGDYMVTTVAGDHPAIAGSGMDAGRSVNRYWTFTNVGLAFNANANDQLMFTFPSSDLDGAATLANLHVGRYGASTWTLTPPPTPTTASPTGTTRTLTLTGTSTPHTNSDADYQIAETGAPLTLVSASVSCGVSTQVEVLFSKPVTAASAQNVANYALSGGATISAAVLGADAQILTLTTSALSSQSYTLTVSNVAAVNGGSIAAGSQIAFFAEGGYLSGLTGSYYTGTGGGGANAFSGAAVERTDGPIAFDWANGTPGVAGIGADGFSVRWTGFVSPPVSGSYTFRTVSDDGVRLYIGGNLVIDNWNDHGSATDNSPAIALTAGQRYAVTMEFYENGGSAVAQLLWNGPATGGFQNIPRSSLSHLCGLPQPVAFYKMDETSWNGTAGEVVDSSGNGLHGTAAGGTTAVGAKVCNGAQFNGTNRFIQVPGLSNRLNATASLAFWIRTTQAGNNLGWQAPGVTGVEQSGGGNDIFWGWLDAAGRIGVSVGDTYTTKSTVAVNDGFWRHVVLTRDHVAGTYKIYIDGALNASGGIATGVIGTAFSSIGRIEDTAGTSVYLNGQLDEVRIYDRILTNSDVAEVYAVTRTCANQVSHYQVSYPNGASGVTCEPSDVLITAHDAVHGAVAPSAGTVIALSTSTGTGAWLAPAVSGGGAWSPSGANNGAATYGWTGSETSLLVKLRQNAVTPALNINLIDSGSRAELEDPSLSVADSAFRVTADGTSSATIGTQLAGKNSNAGFGAQALYVQAIRTDTKTGSCVGLIQGQTINVEMAAARNNPAGGSGQVSVRNSGGGMTALATGPGAFGSYGNVSLSFDALSRAPLVINYPDAGAVSLSMRYQLPAPPSAAYVSGATGQIVVRPFGLRVSGPVAVGAPSPSVAVFAKAGADFNVSVTAVQWKAGDDADADGVPDSDAQIASNGATPNFGQETPAATATLAHSLNAPAGGAAGTLGGTLNFTGFSAGARTQAVNWSEVGFIDLTAMSANYLGSGQSVSNSGAGFTGIGRFYPGDFVLSGTSTVTTRSGAGCTPASTFSYMGEAFSLGFMLTARNTQGGTTRNYTGAYARLGLTTFANFNFGARSGTTNLTSRIDSGLAPSGTWLDGVATVAATTAIRRATPDNPDGPYAGLLFGIVPTDADGVGIGILDQDVDNNAVNDHKSLGAATELRFGQLRLYNSAGSQKLPRSVRAELQYWSGSAFTVNSQDNCTTLAPSTIALGYTAGSGLVSCETAVTTLAGAPVTFTAGAGNITLAAPGAANTGSLLVTPQLGAAASGSYCTAVAGSYLAALPGMRRYLLGRRDNAANPDGDATTSYDDNPSARISFGVYGAQPRSFTFFRENY